jgi:uncharacterized protein (DUF2147 family)
MRKSTLSMGSTFAALALASPAAAADATPYGHWARGDGIAKVVIEPCGDALCAINIWIRPGVTDEKVGERLVMNIKRQDSSRWVGTAFDPKRDLTFDITVEVAPSAMKTNGCVLGGMLCKTVAWTRIAGK